MSHRGEGINAARFIAALGAAVAVSDSIDSAIDEATNHIPRDSETALAVIYGRSLGRSADAVEQLHEFYGGMTPVHALNNLSLVVWAISSAGGDFSAAVGETVAAGWDTDCNGATVGGLLGLAGVDIPDTWLAPWDGRVGVSLAGYSELRLDDVVDRTVAVARSLQ